MNDHVELLGELADENRAVSLFRYMQINTLLLLLERKVFFPSVNSLHKSDPFEGELFCESPRLMTELHQIPTQDAEGKLDQWLREQASEWERKAIDSNDTSPGFRSDILAKIYTRELKERRATWCWFESDLESAGMWSVYGHKGIAVRTSVAALRSSLPSDGSFRIARMRYVDRRPCSEKAFDPEGKDRHLILHPHLLKAVEYQHEQEIRVLTECPAKCGGVLVEGINWESLIEEIVISPLLPAQEATAVKNMLEKHPGMQPIRIETSTLLPDMFMDTHDGLLEAIRQDNGGHYEKGLPGPIAEL